MTFIKMAAAAALLTLIPTAAMAQTAAPTAADCDAWFMKVDTNKDGSLGQQEEATKFIGMKSQSSVDDQNNGATANALTLTKEDFLTECAKGTYGMPMN
jgi:hypothetical protein